ncbi:MAG TPA: transporter substrate-binding domain-containing protein [Anaerolineales bacterium]|nr:transporter substrate-binding domain-containing protein [Anaerolineales bacterium]
MKKRMVYLSVLLAVALAACTGQAAGPSGSAAQGLPDLKGRDVTVAVENAYVPFNYIDPSTGQAAGWDYEVWNEMCRLLNCKPVYTEAAWDGMILAVSQGQFDAAADGITITPDRSQIVDFSDGYISVDQRLLVRKDETRVKSMQDLVNDPSLKLGTQTGTTNYETAKKFLPEEQISAFDTFPFAVQALIAGEIDAVIIDDTAGQGYVGENSDQVKLVGDSLSSDMLGFAFPKGSDLVPAVNAALKAMTASGFLAKINGKYFPPGSTFTP